MNGIRRKPTHAVPIWQEPKNPPAPGKTQPANEGRAEEGVQGQAAKPGPGSPPPGCGEGGW